MNPAYESYGGRGIKVCKEWRYSPEAFCEWGEEHKTCPGLTLDRIDNDGDYSPENCRWADQKQQANNRRSTRTICFNGVEHSLIEWSRIFGLRHSTIQQRLNRGWDVEMALTTPGGPWWKRRK
jgi:hypothetical protein